VRTAWSTLLIETWATDFVHDQLATGRKLHVLTRFGAGAARGTPGRLAKRCNYVAEFRCRVGKIYSPAIQSSAAFTRRWNLLIFEECSVAHVNKEAPVGSRQLGLRF
jgi:hypothetical protein